MLELLTSPEAWISFATLAALEIVLGIDNIVFITIVTGRLPPEEQPAARRMGLGVALVSRLGLLFALSWIMGLTSELFEVFGHGISGKDLVLLIGGLFLLAKATKEIYETVEDGEGHGAEEDEAGAGAARAAYSWILLQVVFLDIVFSLDSVITAVGMVKDIPIMVAAMITAVAVMVLFAGPVGDFVQRHTSVQVLALSFLVLIGSLLVAEAFGQHIPKGYVYFAMAYALAVEVINMRLRKNRAGSRKRALKKATEQMSSSASLPAISANAKA